MGGNLIILHGRLTRDIESRDYQSKSGSNTMATFCVACDAKFGDDAYYFDCTAFGKTGELATAHLRKGSEVLVYGEMTYRDKQQADGTKRRFYSVNVDRFEFCGSKKSDDGFEQINKDVPF